MRLFSPQTPRQVSTLARKAILPRCSGRPTTVIVPSTSSLRLPTATTTIATPRRHLTTTTPKAMSTQNTKAATSPITRYKLVFYAPTADVETCKEAVFRTGAGTFPGGQYSKCAFQTTGTGQFLPSDSANPAIGGAGVLETVQEAKVEVMCFSQEIMREAVRELVKAHPYEEVAYEVYKVEDV